MTHHLPPHGAAALPTEAQHMQQVFSSANDPVDQPIMEDTKPNVPAATSAGRKRRKQDGGGADSAPHTPAEPRRLRRSHEACTRCRSKKIKCDSKHPRCSACASANVDCHQEDRYHQKTTPRGHTDHLQAKLDHAEAMLKGIYGGDFDLEMATQTGMMPAPFYMPMMPPGAPPVPGPSNIVGSAGPPQLHGHAGVMMYPHPLPPGFPHPYMLPPPGSIPSHHLVPGPVPPSEPTYGYAQVPRHGVKGAVLQEHEVITKQTVPPSRSVALDVAIVEDALGSEDLEDLAVGSNGLASERDRNLREGSIPKDSGSWVSVSMRRNNLAMLLHPTADEVTPQPLQTPAATAAASISIYLPENQEMVKRVVSTYFTHLNIHRPVFAHQKFWSRVQALYEKRAGAVHEPGFICSLYLILALGSLCETNNVLGQRANATTANSTPLTESEQRVMPSDWPTHEAFFERALTIKPDLRVTLSSLQALILLHWYLYIERQGRSLWRLVGSMVRLGVELGLHHPRTLESDDDESQTKARLWDIVMMHDRGISLLLGRPLALHPNDSTSPAPALQHLGVSEHYKLSRAIVDVQGDIVACLYTPNRPVGKDLLRHVARILQHLKACRHELGDKYAKYFEGTKDWPEAQRIQLVDSIGVNEGLTLLKLFITRLLFLRVLLNDVSLPPAVLQFATHDALITAHNIIVVHHQMIRFPVAAFFVSPIPLHISAYILLCSYAYSTTALEPENIVDDVLMALDILPRHRWRWNRKDLQGGHPVIHKMSEEVLRMKLPQAGPISNPMLILSTLEWDAESLQTASATVGSTPPTAHMPTFSSIGLYPFHPDSSRNASVPIDPPAHLNAWAHGTPGGYQQSPNSYMAEERDMAPQASYAPSWMQLQQHVSSNSAS